MQERAEPPSRRRDHVGDDQVAGDGEEHAAPEADRRHHRESRCERAGDRAEGIGRRDPAERTGDRRLGA